MVLIVDTGPLFAALNANDRDHGRCAAVLDTGPRAFDAVYADLTSGGLGVVDLTRDQWERVRQLCDQHADLPLGLVDASVVAVAETLGEATIATLDHRHFAVVRPHHVAAFDLVPH